MKHSLFYYFNKVLFNVTIRTFYKRIQVRGAEHLETGKPYVIAMNHPNAFMDPIAFATLVKPPMRFLARGDAFKKGLKPILQAVGIIPIYRLMDSGREGVQKNNETFKIVTGHLKKNNPVIIFAEGLSIQERRLRNLKKGCARIVLSAMEELNKEDILVIPVGINYQNNPSKFRHDLFIEIGKPIEVGKYREQYLRNQAGTINLLTANLQEKMKETIVHISDKENDAFVEHIEEIYLEEYLYKEGIGLDELDKKHEFTMKVCRVIQIPEQKENIEDLKNKMRHYLDQLKKYRIRTRLLSEQHLSRKGIGSLLFRTTLLIIGLPIWIAGLITNYIPYYISWKTPPKIVKDIEWFTSFAVTGGSYIFLLYHLIQFSIVWSLSKNWIFTSSFVLITFFSGWFCLHFSPFRKKLFGSIRYYLLNKKTKEDLIEERKVIIRKIESLLN